MNETLWLESVVNPIYDRKEQLTIESNFAHYLNVSVIVRKEGPIPSCSRTVALSFSPLCLRISQFYFWGQGKGYKSAVECRLDVAVRAWLSLNPMWVFLSILTCSHAVIEWEWIRRGIDVRGWGYISGSELQANMKWIQVMPWNERQFRISFVYEQGISNATMNLMEMAQDERWRHALNMKVGREVVFPVADGWVVRTCPWEGNNSRKQLLILIPRSWGAKGGIRQRRGEDLRPGGRRGEDARREKGGEGRSGWLASWWGNSLAMISSWSERMISHTGTETGPRLLREAAVGNFPQWAKAWRSNAAWRYK